MLGLSAVLLLFSAVPQGEVIKDPMLDYSIELPSGWRQMTFDEARNLRPKMPPDVGNLLIKTVRERFGAVDDWIARDFDGRCLTITREDGEPAMSDATLQRVREVARERSATTTINYEIVALQLGSIGKGKHPAIESSVILRTTNGRAFAKVLEFTIPTGGKTLRFSYRASPTDFAEAEPLFRASAATLQISRPPEGRKELSDKLKMPLIIGGVVGLIFLVLYKMRSS